MSHSHRFRPNLRIDLSSAKQTLTDSIVEQKYDLHEILGQGSVGIVRRATLRGSREQFAIKTVHTNDPEKLLISEKEYKLLSGLRHRNIVKILEFIVDESAYRIDIVMPLISGLRLDVFIKQNGSLPEDAARPLFTQLMLAVLHCHTHRLCHRDIKPENIMVSQENDSPILVLMDFNAACMVGGLTPTGTRQYMSPEAWHAQDLYNEMTDVWSAGVCLYFMLAGYLPWIGERQHVLATEVSSFQIRLPANLSTEALSLLSGLLCRDVVARLMVVGALTHPWCKLSADEVWSLFFNAPASDDRPPQPAYRDWEVKARKTILNGNTAVFGPPLEPPPASVSLSKTVSWPIICGTSSTLELSASPLSPKCVVRSNEHWLSTMPSGESRGHFDWEGRLRRHHRPELYGKEEDPPFRTCFGWEARLRREHLEELYGPSPKVAQSLSSNWETRMRREAPTPKTVNKHC